MKTIITLLTITTLALTLTSCSTTNSRYSHEDKIMAGTLIGGGVGAAANSDRPLAGGIAGAAIGALIGFFSG